MIEEELKVLGDDSEEVKLGAKVNKVLEGVHPSIVFNIILPTLVNQMTDLIQAGCDMDELIEKVSKVMKITIVKTIEHREDPKNTVQ